MIDLNEISTSTKINTDNGKPDGLGMITPINIAHDMVNLLPNNVWNKSTKFLDIACKSGNLLREAYERLMSSESMVKEFPNEKDREDWILNNQLYGIALSETDALIATRNVYGQLILNSNIVYIENYLKYIKGSIDSLKNKIKEELGEMQFDVVVGNPPYNKGMDLDFVDIGYKISNRFVCMITPAKWQTASDDYSGCASKNISYKEFRQKYVPHISQVCFYPCCKDVFDIYQTDGITYYILDKTQTYNQATVINKCNDIEYFNSEACRSILNSESLLNIGQEIIDSLGNYNKFHFPHITHHKRYEIWMNTKVSGYDWYATKNPRYVLSISRLIDNSKGDTYDGEAKCVFESDDLDECKSFVSWVYSRFTRFFLVPNISKLNNIQTDHCFRFVPAPPSGKFDHIYTDEELYKAFNLPQKYIDVIESIIKERK